jgi:hypothetical protein
LSILKLAPLGLLASCLLTGCGEARGGAHAGGGSSGGAGATAGASNSAGSLSLGGIGGLENGGGATSVSTCEQALTAKSAVGCDYYALHPLGFKSPLYRNDFAGSCYAAFVANTSAEAVELHVEYEGQQLDVAKFARLASGSGHALSYAPLPDGRLPPQQVAMLFLSGAPVSAGYIVACPEGVEPAVPQAISLGAAPSNGDETAPTGGAFHITASAPVVAYDIFPYGGGSTAIASATLLFPTTSWGKNYVTVDAYQQTSTDEYYSSLLAFVAAEDETQVDVRAAADLVDGSGAVLIGKGQTGKLLLDRGETLRFAQLDSLNGSVLESNRPIGVWGGSTSLKIPAEYAAADFAHQQIPPVGVLGSEYVAAPYRPRYDGAEEVLPWRVLGVVPGTVLTYEPARPSDAPEILSEGQLATFRATGPFVVRSQDAEHPFYVSGHMTGCAYAESQTGEFHDRDCRGDPEFVNVVPTAQYLRSYSFFTDPTYPETNLVIVRKKVEGAFAEVKLDCAGTLGAFSPISADYEYARIDLVRHDFQGQGNCDNGRHFIESSGPFGVTVWGWGSGETRGQPGAIPTSDGLYTQCVSYAYPAGAGVAQVNEVKVPVVK